jgi:predicted RNA-binding protein YlxR (DUF448 family)
MSATQPVRTCVGCRERGAKSDLLRVVRVATSHGWDAYPDDDARRPGRGAYLHLSLACLDLAERRRALPRALKSEGTLDLTMLRSWIEARTPIPPGSAQSSNTETTD